MHHKHHIIPRHMGGTDDPSNIETITVEAHAERHRLLFETHHRWQDEVAWKTLTGQMTCAEAIKIAQQQPKSDEWKRQASERFMGEKNPMFGKPSWNKGKHDVYSEESRMKMSEAAKSRPSNRVASWQITTPQRVNFIIHNLSEYCRTNRLTQSCMVLVSQGGREHHKGYTCKKLS